MAFNYNLLKTNLRKRIQKDIRDKDIFTERLMEAYENIEQRAEDLKSSLNIDVTKDGYEAELDKFSEDSKEIAAEEISNAILDVFIKNLSKIFVQEYKRTESGKTYPNN